MIPKVFHRIWLGGQEPAWLAAFAETWLRHHPGWDLEQWDDAMVKSLFPLRNQDLYDRAEEIAPHNVGQLRSDILRYEILERFGGVYIDADFECLKSIEPLLDSESFAPITCFAAWVDRQWLNNAIMGSVPGHAFMGKVIDGLPASVDQFAGHRPNVMSGPQHLTRVYRKTAHGVAVFAKELFYPYLWNELDRVDEDFPDAFAIHHWNNKRKQTGAGCP